MQATLTGFVRPEAKKSQSAILIVTDLPDISTPSFALSLPHKREFYCGGSGVLDPRDYPLEKWHEELDHGTLGGIVFLGDSRAMVLGRYFARYQQGGVCFVPSLGGFELLFSRWFMTTEGRKPIVHWDPEWAPENRTHEWLLGLGTETNPKLDSVYQVSTLPSKTSQKELYSNFFYLVGRIYEAQRVVPQSSEQRELTRVLDGLQKCFQDKVAFLTKGSTIVAEAWITLGRKGLLPPLGLSFGLSLAASYRLGCDPRKTFVLFAQGEGRSKDQEWFTQAFSSSGDNQKLRHLGALTRQTLHSISDSFVAQEFFPPGSDVSHARALVYKVS
ncbi:MAG: hypothetical protein GW949_10705 [Spirochaetales bacterium]|nr:hypothetical protein [Spirochaetales bacterium]